MRRILSTANCAGMINGKDEGSADFDKETSANEARVKADRVRSSKIEIYGPSILRDGQVDGARVRGTGHWGLRLQRFPDRDPR